MADYDVASQEESSPSSSDPFEPEGAAPDGEAGEEDSSEEITPRANRRIQALVHEKKGLEGKVQTLESQVQQLLNYSKELYSTNNQPRTNASSAPAASTEPDSDTQLILSKLGGDETAKQIYDVLEMHFEKKAKTRGLVGKEDLDQAIASRLNSHSSMRDAAQTVVTSIQGKIAKGTLDQKEAGWVAQKVQELVGQNAGWLATPQTARLLVNNIVQEGMENGEIVIGRKSTEGSSTPIGPGRVRGDENDAKRDFAATKKAATKFRTLRNLDDKELKRLSKGANVLTGNAVSLMKEIQ